MRKFLIIALFMLFIYVVVFPGCAGADKEVISFADKAAENYLIALNNKDYENFKKDLDNKMLEAIPEEEFIKFSSYLKNTVGEYVKDSKEISTSGVKGEMYVIVYGADYTEETEEVTVTVSISEFEDGNYKISGSWFNSAGLRENPYQ